MRIAPGSRAGDASARDVAPALTRKLSRPSSASTGADEAIAGPNRVIVVRASLSVLDDLAFRVLTINHATKTSSVIAAMTHRVRADVLIESVSARSSRASRLLRARRT